MPTELITKTDGEIISDSMDRIANAISFDLEPSLAAGLSSALHRSADGIQELAIRNGDATDRLASEVGELSRAIAFGFASLSDAIRSLKVPS